MYSIVVDDALYIIFDGDTSLRRGTIEHKGGRRARWSILGAKAKEVKCSYHNNLNISVDTTTNTTAPVHLDSYQKKRHR